MGMFKDMFAEISAELRGPRKSEGRGEHSEEVQHSRALKNMEMLASGITVVSTALAGEADAELDALLDNPEAYAECFKKWEQEYSKPKKYKAFETVKVKNTETGEETEEQREVEKTRPILKPLASPELHGTRFGQVRALQPGEYVEKVMKLLDRGTTVEAIELGAGENIRRFAWAKVRGHLMAIAKEKSYNLSSFCKLFGLEEEGTVVIPSEDASEKREIPSETSETEEPAKKASRQRKTKAA